MKRFFENDLVRWKSAHRRKPLIVRGARQVGKTYCVESFGKKHFDHFISIDFEREKKIHQIFNGDLSVDTILLQMEAVGKSPITPGKTLIFFDEIQECPQALASLRYFFEQKPDLHIIAAGSLLEFALQDISFPVGRVELQWLRPMGFEEFLWAMGHSKLAENLPFFSEKKLIDPFIHEKIIEQLRIYFITGGMPEAILAFKETSSLNEVNQVHKSLYQSYRQDLNKYSRPKDRPCLEHIFELLPRKVGERIKYVSLFPEKRIEKIKDALHILENTLLVQRVRSSKANGLPLGADASPKVFKSLFLDIGLMQHICGISQFEILNEKNILDVYRGSLAEQFIGQELLLAGGSENDTLYYWDRPKKSSSAEVDYLIVRSGCILPVEVKSGLPSRLKSINIFLDEHPHSKWGLVLHGGNALSDTGKRLKFMPLYTKLTEQNL